MTLPGCFPKPNAANIALRKEVQSLQQQLGDLQSQRAADQAQVKAFESGRAIETLPADRLSRLFTASGLRFKRLVVGEDTDRNQPGDEAFKIGLAPVDQFGEEFKSAGTITVEVFDLAAEQPRLGSWTIDTVEAQRKWLSTPVFDGYVLQWPWQTVPQRAKLLVKATFVEELTGRRFDAQADLTINPPPATQPTQPASPQ